MTVTGKDITLHGAGTGQTIIESPDAASLVANAIDTNSGRPNKFAVITVTDNADVTIEGLTVDGRDQAPFRPQTMSRARTMTSWASTCSTPMPISMASQSPARTNSPVSMSPASSATTRSSPPATTSPTAAPAPTPSKSRTRPSAGSRRPGIFVNGSTLTANIHDNTIVGAHTANTAQNGIQVGSLFGAVGDGDFSGTHATIDHNTITDIGNSGPAGSASGIIVFDGDASSVSITNNTLTGWVAPQANGNSGITFVDSNGGTVTGNTISGFDAGLNALDQFGGTSKRRSLIPAISITTTSSTSLWNRTQPAPPG